MSTPSALRGLYVITDAQLCAGHGLANCVLSALRGGARLVQYRDKSEDHARRKHEATVLRELTREFGALFIVNDDIELAFDCNADGVHLGRDDAALEQARKRLGREAIVGVSCYNDLARAEHFAKLGADYLAFGSVFPSNTKPDGVHAPLSLFAQAKSFGLPLCAIGGIEQKNAPDLVSAGADMLAVISGVFAAADIEAAARAYAAAFD